MNDVDDIRKMSMSNLHNMSYDSNSPWFSECLPQLQHVSSFQCADKSKVHPHCPKTQQVVSAAETTHAGTARGGNFGRITTISPVSVSHHAPAANSLQKLAFFRGLAEAYL